LVRIPRRPGRQRLRLVVVRQRSEIAPGGIAARERHHAGGETEEKQKQAQQKEGRRGGPGSGKAQARQKGREKDREESGFDEEEVPLKCEERLARDGKRQVQHGRRGEGGRR